MLLGVAAFAADVTPEAIGRVLAPFGSSGSAWGAAALFTAYFARTLKSSISTAVATLVLATITYYCLILFVSHRWYQDASMTLDGQSDSISGLMSVFRTLTFWLGGSVLGGVLMGCLANRIRSGSALRGATCLGVTFGMLAGEGLYTLFQMRFVWVGAIDSHYWQSIRDASIQLLIATATLVTAARLRRRPINRVVLAATAALSAVGSAVLWYAIESVTVTM